MSFGALEVLVEPFKENEPGPHVTVVVDELRRAGLDADMGPFATTVEGELDDIIGVIQHVLTAGFAKGATTIQLRVEKR